ncbi:tyrosine-protein phosphatase [Arthrobacter echini]|uniref:Tyrosine-protein phosphatase n=1 Tax=Arthrobacter echini TaxID=1529066 RepID=A0A4S5E9J7_9MICC|nr:tyrosine-protein phosphatase [Arthrobacter echini]THJ68375.1 tyrosine-protein phosphatase [Arthrobacter echini]
MDAVPAAPPPAAVGSSPDALWEGAVNARDLGGTGLVQRGRLYRMGRHEWVTQSGWDQAWDDGVRTVIDLRNPFELGRRPTDPAVPPEVLDRFRLHNLPTEDQSDAEFMALTGPYLNTPEHYGENLLRWPRKFAAIARAFVSAPVGGVVVHCAAGRDRTGMVVALLLSAAQVPHSAIVADYAAAVTAVNDRYRGQETPHETPRSDEELAAWLEDAEGFLHELLASLDAAELLRTGGLSEEELELLRARLTDPGWAD